MAINHDLKDQLRVYREYTNELIRKWRNQEPITPEEIDRFYIAKYLLRENDTRRLERVCEEAWSQHNLVASSIPGYVLKMPFDPKNP